MKKEFQEQKLTAYLLGELDEAESREVERILEASESARRELDELRETIGILAQGLQSEILLTPPETLDDIRRAAVEERIEAAGSKTGPSKSFFSSSWIWGLSAAASLLLVALLSYPFWPWRSDSGQIMQQAELRSDERGRGVARQPAESDSLAVPQSPAVPPMPGQAETTSPGAGPPSIAVGRDGEAQAARRTDIDSPARLSAPPDSTPPAAASTPRETRIRETVSPPSRAAITGHITDATGAALPGVGVKLRSAPTGEMKASTVSDAGGQFQVPAVPGNQYLVEAELPGFKSALVGPLTSKSGESVDASLRLEVGEVSDAVRVTGAGEPAADQPPAVENREVYSHYRDNPFVAVSNDSLSTFSIDVDTASYTNVRRFLNSRQLPPPDAVRIEEMLNYFDYSYAQPTGRHPIAAHAEIAEAFWKPEHRLVRIGLRARDIPSGTRPPVNLVFLVDVSGSMKPEEKLPLLKQGLALLVDRLESKDRIAVVTYAGDSRLVLPSTSGDQKDVIRAAIGRLYAGGSTNGGAGIRTAYEQALASLRPEAVNRVVLASDGDFNVGITDQGELIRYVENQAKKGVYLTILGFGMGNYQDARLKKLAEKGNGNYAYIDDLSEARRVLVERMAGTLLPVAKDVKIQVEFNPHRVAAYRLIGYENRVMAHQDFADDTRDAGEMGAGHTVTALYEVVPVGVPVNLPEVEPLKYQAPAGTASAAGSAELLTLKIRYKDPGEEASRRMEVPVTDQGPAFDHASDDFRFAAAVASFGMVLRNSPHQGETTLDGILEIARSALGADPGGHRADFVRLVLRARELGY
jgi:Ca-activated chloride channel homolog